MKKTIQGILAFAFVAMAHAGAFAAEFKIFQFKNSTEKFIVMTGDVRDHDLNRLKSAWMTAGVPVEGATIFLNSPGGNGDEMKKLSKFIAEKKMSTVVHSNDICMSACAVMWAHGAERWMQEGARIGFHVGSMAMSPESVEWLDGFQGAFGWQGIQTRIQENMMEDFNFFHSMPVAAPDIFVAKIAMFGSVGHSFWELTRDDLWIVDGRFWEK